MKSVCASVCLHVRVCVHDRCVSYCSYSVTAFGNTLIFRFHPVPEIQGEPDEIIREKCQAALNKVFSCLDYTYPTGPPPPGGQVVLTGLCSLPR